MSFLKEFLRQAAVFIAAFFYGRIYEQKEQAEDDAKSAKEEAQRRAASGVVLVPDAVQRLRARAARKRRNENKRNF